MQTFELLLEHRFSPNNIHAFTISEPCILPVFCKAIQAVRYKPLKHLYIQLTHLFDCYIYTFIYYYVNTDRTLTKIFTLNETQPLPPIVTSPSSPLLTLFPDPCVKLWIPSCLCRIHITLNLFYWVRRIHLAKNYFSER